MASHSYFLSYPYADWVADRVDESTIIYCSSSASGERIFWPPLQRFKWKGLPEATDELETHFEIHRYKTLAIVGLFLVSSDSPENASWILKNISENSQLPFTVISPGNSYDAILEALCDFEQFFERFLVIIYPSCVKGLIKRAEQLGIKLPFERLRLVLGGEAGSNQLLSSRSAKLSCLNTQHVWTQFLTKATYIPHIAKALSFAEYPVRQSALMVRDYCAAGNASHL